MTMQFFQNPRARLVCSRCGVRHGAASAGSPSTIVQSRGGAPPTCWRCHSSPPPLPAGDDEEPEERWVIQKRHGSGWRAVNSDVFNTGEEAFIELGRYTDERMDAPQGYGLPKLKYRVVRIDKLRSNPRTILVDSKGRPIEKPRRSDYRSDVEYVRAFHAYKDRIAREATAGFDAGFGKGLRDNPNNKALEARALRAAAAEWMKESKRLRPGHYRPKLKQESERLEKEAAKALALADRLEGKNLRDNPDDGGLGAFGTGVLVLAAVGITYLMFREKPGKEPEPAPAPTPTPTPPPVATPPVVIPSPPVIPTPCVVTAGKFSAWLVSKGFAGTWLTNVQVTPPILSALKAEFPALESATFDKIAVATHDGDQIWYYNADGEPYTQKKIRFLLCQWIATNP